MGLHPGGQLLQGKGLGQIVVRPQVQPLHDILYRILGAEEQNGAVHPSPDLPAHLQPAEALHHNVQQDQVEAPLLHTPERFLPGADGRHLQPLLLQHVGDQQKNGYVVVYQKNLLMHPAAPPFPLMIPQPGQAKP